MKQIIVEGPDGAGKSTLIQTLSRDLDLPVNQNRSCTSTGGPVKNLNQWIVDDLRSWDTKTTSLYDRHPMVSDHIYGPVLRKEVQIHLPFGYYRRFVEDAIVVLCLPPLGNVTTNLESEDQLAGVWENIATIYSLYEAYARQNQDRVLWYDYTLPGSYWDLHRILLGMTRSN